MSPFYSLMTFTIMTVISIVFMKLATEFKKDFFLTLNQYKSKVLMIVFFILSIIPLAIISGFRINVGTDFPSYVNMFENPGQYIGIPNFFRNILLYLSRNGLDVQGMFILSSIIIIFCYYFSAITLSYKPDITILLFIIGEDFFASMNIIRQFIAVGILLIAYFFYQKKRKFWGLILNVIAFLIHPSIIIFNFFLILLYLLKRIRISKVKVIVLVLLSPFLTLLVPMFKKIIFFTEYGKFLSNDYAQLHYRWTLLMLLVYSTVLLLTTSFLNFKKYGDNLSVKKFIYSNVIIIYIISSSYFISGNTYRLIYVITPFMYIYYPSAIDSIDDTRTRIVVNFVNILIFLTGTIIMITHSNNDVIPYYNILF